MLLALGLLVIVQVTWFSELDPGNAFGLGYGIAAAGLLALAMAYGVRRRFMKTATRWKLGKAKVWLRFHLALGVLFLALTLVHSGLRLPRGVLTWWLLILSVWIVATGLVGWFLQRWVPKALSGLETEVLYERIPELCQSLKERATLLAAGGEEPVRLLYERLLEPELAGPHRRFRYLVDVQGGHNLQWREIAYLRDFLAAEEKKRLMELESIVRTKVELDVHYTLQPLLRWWLVLHLPPSIALAGLVAVHIATVVYY
ncbi:MAG: hypothetical protein K8J08_04250 [Thermoanaerobaculia bacterium]|nr:hypothetical protein [Thermoanaerobaculia bacterium]